MPKILYSRSRLIQWSNAAYKILASSASSLVLPSSISPGEISCYAMNQYVTADQLGKAMQLPPGVKVADEFEPNAALPPNAVWEISSGLGVERPAPLPDATVALAQDIILKNAPVKIVPPQNVSPEELETLLLERRNIIKDLKKKRAIRRRAKIRKLARKKLRSSYQSKMAEIEKEKYQATLDAHRAEVAAYKKNLDLFYQQQEDMMRNANNFQPQNDYGYNSGSSQYNGDYQDGSYRSSNPYDENDWQQGGCIRSQQGEGCFQDQGGSYQSQPGAYQSQPGAYQSQPGAYQSQPGAYQSQPGAYQSQGGSYQSQGSFQQGSFQG